MQLFIFEKSQLQLFILLKSQLQLFIGKQNSIALQYWTTLAMNDLASFRIGVFTFDMQTISKINNQKYNSENESRIWK